MSRIYRSPFTLRAPSDFMSVAKWVLVSDEVLGLEKDLSVVCVSISVIRLFQVLVLLDVYMYLELAVYFGCGIGVSLSKCSVMMASHLMRAQCSVSCLTDNNRPMTEGCRDWGNSLYVSHRCHQLMIGMPKFASIGLVKVYDAILANNNYYSGF